jgi:hypothetical protein
VITGALTFVTALVALMARWIMLTNINDLENFLNKDLDRNGKIGGTIHHTIRVQIDEVKEDKRLGVSKLFDLEGIEPKQLKALGIGIIDEHKGWTETEWSPLKKGLPFSIDQIRYVKKTFVKRGLLKEIIKGAKVTGYVETVMLRGALKKWKEINLSDYEQAPSPSE